MSSPEHGVPDAAGEPAGADTAAAMHGLFDRTWELELLISGVVVFALVQIPGHLVRAFDRLSIELGDALYLFVWLVYVYLQLAVLAVTAALLVHLLARAYWVGLIGLRTVYPHGVRWRRLGTHGPRSKAVLRALLPSLGAQIRRANVFCSSIFSFAFALAAISLFGILLVAPIVAVATAVDRTLFGGEALLRVLYVAVVVLVVLPSSLPLIDKLAPRRRRGDRLARLIRSVFGRLQAALGARLHSPIFLTFQTNARTASFFGLFFLVFGLFLVGFLGHQLVHDGNLVFRSANLPTAFGADGLDPRFYDDQRPAGRAFDVPSIPSDVVEGPYLRVFVPHVPRRDGEALAARCPEVAKGGVAGLRLVRDRDRDRPRTADQEQRSRALLDCFAEVYRFSVDGVTLSDPALRFAAHPATGVAGLALRLPTAGLEAGEHVLRITRPSTRAAARDDAEARAVVYTIPFWR